jgi:Fe-S cluster assembly protein SufD
VSALLDSLAEGFEALAPGLDHVDARRGALEATRRLELPTQRAERWRYTSLRALAARRLRPAREGDGIAIGAHLLDAIPTPRLVFVNGQFVAALSDASSLPDHLAFQPEHVAPVDVPATRADDAFVRLNAAFAISGARVAVASDVEIETPLHLVFVGAPVDGDLAVHLRHAISLGANARATIVEHHVSAGAHRHVLDHAVDVEIGEDATLTHVRIQDEDAGAQLFARTTARLAAHAGYHRVDLELGSGLSRNELAVILAGQQAHLHSGGVLAAAQRRHLDTRLEVVHAARDTRCDLLWRGAAAGRARVAFHGGITINVGADGSAAALSNKNLLLSDQAEIDTQPVLEIHADEVTASHGATVGRLDPAHLFYLRSRGIGEAQARSILTAAFGRESLAPLGNSPLAEPLAERLRERLAALDSE